MGSGHRQAQGRREVGPPMYSRGWRKEDGCPWDLCLAPVPSAGVSPSWRHVTGAP